MRRAQRSFEQQLGSAARRARRDADVDAGVLLGLAYPDRIGRRRAGRRRALPARNGRGAVFASAESIAREEFIVAVDLDDREREARILLAAPLARRTCSNTSRRNCGAATSCVWDERTEAVVARAWSGSTSC